MTMQVYSFKDVVMTIDGQRVMDFWEGDDVVQVERREDLAEVIVGADGCSIASQTADDSVEITLKLKRTSPTHRLLLQRVKQSKSRSAKPFPVSVTDIHTNEGGFTHGAIVTKVPAIQKGTNATEAEWMLVAGRWENNITNA